MAILKTSRATIVLPDGSEITQDTVGKVPSIVTGGEHIVRQDVQNGYGIVIEDSTGASNFAVSVDRKEFYNKDEVGMIETNITEAYEESIVDKITKYETDHVSIVYATKEEVEDLQNEAMSNYTLKTVTNKVWTTSVTTFATKAELDEMGKKYGVGVVIMGAVDSHKVFDIAEPEYDFEYSPSNPKRFQGETYFTSDLKHLWQFNASNAIIASPQVVIDRVNGFELGETTLSSQFQLWIGKEHPMPEELITVKFGFSNEGFVKITAPGETEALDSITVAAKMLAPNSEEKIKLEIHYLNPTATKFEEFVMFTTYAGLEEVPQILKLTSPIYFNGFIPAARNIESRMIASQNRTSNYKVPSSGASTYSENLKAVLPGDDLIGTTITGTYGNWLNLGSIVGPANELVEEVLIDTIKRTYVTVAGSQPDLTELHSTAKVLSEYPTQQLEISVVEGVQGAPGVLGNIGNKITPKTIIELDTNNNRDVVKLAWEEFDHNNKPIKDVIEGGINYDPNNPNTEYDSLPSTIRIEGLDSFEVWKDYYLREQGVEESFLTKANYLLDITGDSAFKFWITFIKAGVSVEDMIAQIPGFGEWFTEQDIKDYIAFQKGDAYIPTYDEATGTMKFEFFDKHTSPEEEPSHDLALDGWRVRGQVYEPTINHANGELSFERKHEESTLPNIEGVNIRGNVWVPSVDVVTGLLSWANTKDSGNPADVSPEYVYGPIFEPVITYEKVTRPETIGEGGFDSYEDEREVLSWTPTRKPSDLQTATNIKGLKGSPVKVELELLNDVELYDEFAVEISEPEYFTTADHVGFNTQKLKMFTPFDKHNIKIHDANGTAWFVGIDTEGRLNTSNTPFSYTEKASFAAASKRKMEDMRKKIAELQDTISTLKSDN